MLSGRESTAWNGTVCQNPLAIYPRQIRKEWDRARGCLLSGGNSKCRGEEVEKAWQLEECQGKASFWLWHGLWMWQDRSGPKEAGDESSLFGSCNLRFLTLCSEFHFLPFPCAQLKPKLWAMLVLWLHPFLPGGTQCFGVRGMHLKGTPHIWHQVPEARSCNQAMV